MQIFSGSASGNACDIRVPAARDARVGTAELHRVEVTLARRSLPRALVEQQGKGHFEAEAIRRQRGSLQDRQHSLLRPCYLTVLDSGKMLRGFPNLAKSRDNLSNLV